MTLSPRQYPLLKQFAEAGYLSIDDAKTFDQRPFRSMLIRQYIAYHPGRGFKITKKGAQAWSEFHSTSITRRNPTLPLTAYFDPKAYGLRLVKMPKSA